jgi:hypothetical protein
MGVRKSGRRRIEVAGRSFVWYVCGDPDSLDMVLHVVSEDKRFLVNYHIAQPGEPLLIVIGRDFPGVHDVGGVWRRFRCPRWVPVHSGLDGVMHNGVGAQKDLHRWLSIGLPHPSPLSAIPTAQGSPWHS